MESSLLIYFLFYLLFTPRFKNEYLIQGQRSISRHLSESLYFERGICFVTLLLVMSCVCAHTHRPLTHGGQRNLQENLGFWVELSLSELHSQHLTDKATDPLSDFFIG